LLSGIIDLFEEGAVLGKGVLEVTGVYGIIKVQRGAA
jgi:DNA-binding ferritin-like protein (Dps family)